MPTLRKTIFSPNIQAAVKTDQIRRRARHPDAVKAIRAVSYWHQLGYRGALAYVRLADVPYPLYRLARQLDALHQGEF